MHRQNRAAAPATRPTIAVCTLALALALALAPTAYADEPVGTEGNTEDNAEDNASKRTASLVHYGAGKKLYKSGEFAQAIAKFEFAYSIYPAAEYLYNLGQSYRRLGDCRAVEHYHRYLDAKPDSPQREVVQRHLAAMTESCEDAGSSTAVEHGTAAKPDPGPGSGDNGTAAVLTGNAATDDEAARKHPVTETAPIDTARSGAPRRLFAIAEFGLSLYDIGDVTMPIITTTRIGLGYELGLGPVDLGASFAVSLAPMRARAVMTMSEKTVLLSTAAAGVSLGYRPHRRWQLRAELGAGILAMSGLSAGNPFTVDGRQRPALAMMNLRAALSVVRRVGTSLELQLSPVFERGSGDPKLADDISTVSSVAVMAGLSVRL